MPLIRRHLEVPYSAAQMYALVDDIVSYPEFLPWCKKATIYSRTVEEVRASITIAKGGLQQSFSTLNRLQQDKMIEVHLIEGPFRHLQGFWLFEALEADSCKISFDLEFEFSNRLLGLTIGPILEKIAETFIDAFHSRAKEIYGEKNNKR